MHSELGASGGLSIIGTQVQQLVRGVRESKQDAMETMAEPVPLHLRNAPTRLMKELVTEGLQVQSRV